MNKIRLHKIFLLISTIAVLHGIYMIVIAWGGELNPVALKFFTIQSNILVMIYFIHRIITYNKKSALSTYLLMSSLIAVIITGMVYNLVLVPIGGGPMIFSDYGNFATHLLATILALINYFCFEQKGNFTRKHMLAGMIFPLLYWIVFISIGDLINFQPYFFMNPGQIGWPMVFVWLGVFVVVFVLLGLGIMAFDKKWGKQSAK